MIEVKNTNAVDALALRLMNDYSLEDTDAERIALEVIALNEKVKTDEERIKNLVFDAWASSLADTFNLSAKEAGDIINDTLRGYGYGFLTCVVDRIRAIKES